MAFPTRATEFAADRNRRLLSDSLLERLHALKTGIKAMITERFLGQHLKDSIYRNVQGENGTIFGNQQNINNYLEEVSNEEDCLVRYGFSVNLFAL